MRYLLFICFYLIGVYACNTRDPKESHQISKSGIKSRIEQVKELPYRNMGISTSIDEEIKIDLKKIIVMIDTTRDYQMFWKSNSGAIHRVDYPWNSFEDMMNYSYNFWKDHPVKFTCLAYLSITQSAITGEIDSIFVYEIEHKDLTGTIRVFVDSSMNQGLTEVKYQERN